MAVTTIRGQHKLAIAKMLKDKGLVVWRCFSPMHRLYALIILACNKLNPADPWKAYCYLSHELHRLTKQKSLRKADKEKVKQARVDSLRRELAMLTNDGVCPCCGGEWDCKGLVPEVGDHIAIPPHKS